MASYKNIFKIFSEVNNMQEGNEAISQNESINKSSKIHTYSGTCCV